MNTQVLERLAAASGGSMVAAGDVESLPGRLTEHAARATLSVRRDVWHNGWWLFAIVLLLCAEWVLRRRWGLR